MIQTSYGHDEEDDDGDDDDNNNVNEERTPRRKMYPTSSAGCDGNQQKGNAQMFNTVSNNVGIFRRRG